MNKTKFELNKNGIAQKKEKRFKKFSLDECIDCKINITGRFIKIGYNKAICENCYIYRKNQNSNTSDRYFKK